MTEQHEKYANELEKALAQFSENVNKIVTEMFSFEGKKEKDWKMKCPYKDRDKYYIVNSRGLVKFLFWNNSVANKKTFNQGHIFPTKQEAELEAKRRNLLTRFRAFRDECNGDWKADWSDSFKSKHYLEIIDSKVVLDSVNYANRIATFGYFKNEKDAERAIELFGDEIQKLFAEG
jgi:hypothetical protein